MSHNGMEAVVLTELPPVAIPTSKQGESSVGAIRVFTLTLHGVTVELCSLGASVTKWLIPSRSPASTRDDVVLGFRSPLDLYESGNPPYFGVVVGRVANRIADGILELEQDKAVKVQLERNNWPNHLHGGSGGFSTRLWDARIVVDDDHENENNDDDDEKSNQTNAPTGVQFSLLSRDGDQDYPGSVLVSATYRLRLATAPSNGIILSLTLEGSLQGDTPTPINLANHTYFNLSRHDDPHGILDHTLVLRCDHFTPTNSVSIPTRQVVDLAAPSFAAMDWRQEKPIRQALHEFAVNHAGQTPAQASADLSRTRVAPDVALSSDTVDPPRAPYGFDHNYVLSSQQDDGSLHTVGTLRHPILQRSMTVRSTAPGVQLYTANYLDGVAVDADVCKDTAVYGQWQGLCLETQHYPDSVLVDDTRFPEFTQGKCVVLRPESPHYRQDIEYEVCFPTKETGAKIDTFVAPVEFRGSDTEGNYYPSPCAMWKAQGVYSASTAAASWYSRATDYYEDNCPPTVDGVLGGFAAISDLDLEGSRAFLNDVVVQRGYSSVIWSAGAACECGAGIGRVSKGLLLPLGVQRCDLVESSPRLLAAAPDYIGDDGGVERCRFYCQGLQEWMPRKSSYSIVWIQWVFCYLTDEDAIAFLRRCGESLLDSGGVICLKENTCDDQDFIVDVEDASLSRSARYLHWLAREAGLRIVHAQIQDNFPDQIFPVYQLALEVATP